MSPQLRDSGIREIFACGILNTENFAGGTRSPGLWNPESRLRLDPKSSSTDRLKSSGWNPESMEWYPESKTVLDSLNLVPRGRDFLYSDGDR